MSQKQEAEVLFDYEKTQDDELSLMVGNIIQDVVTADEGWCEGTLNGKRGLFPDNFVKVRPAKIPPPAQPPSQPPPEPKAPVTRDGGGAIKSRRAKVAYSYTAESPDELSLQPGQIVEVIAEEEEGWFRGRLNNKEGVFPSNFVESNPVPAEPTPPPPEPVRPEEPAAPPKQPPMGHKLFPSINPALARAQLKSSNQEKKAAPPPASTIPKPERPPEKKAPVERAKVVFVYNADNEDELTVNTGDVVEIISKDIGQDGWWMVKLGDKTGLVPDNFVEILPASTAPPPIAKAKHLPPKETPAPAQGKPLTPRSTSQSVSRPPPPQPDPIRSSSMSRPQPQRPPPPTEQKSSIIAAEEEEENADGDFGIPHTDPLDSSAVKNRPKKSSRPPSRSNLLMDEENSSEPPPEPKAPAPQGGGGGGGLTPWQTELQKRKVHKPPPMAPGNKPHPPTAPKKAIKLPEKPAAAAKPTPAPPKPQAATKPHVDPIFHPPRDTPSPHPPPSVPPIPPASTPTHIPIAAAPPADNQWKEAYENLRDDFEKFKKFVQQQFATLTNDLDDERKHWRGLEVDIDRLKKQPSYPK